MVTEEELRGFRRDRYFARSWALLTRDRGWIKPVLVMTVALLVPIVGLLGVLGYALEWARLTAWNVNAVPKQRGVEIGACIKSGWRGFVVMLVWGIVAGVVVGFVSSVPLIGSLFSLVWLFASFVFIIVTMAAALRATIYQKIGAGLRVPTIWQMVKHDAGGLVRIACILLLGGLVMSVVFMIVAAVILAGVLPRLFWFASYFYDTGAIVSDSALVGAYALQFLAGLLDSLGPAFVILLLVTLLLDVILTLVAYTAVGLWMRQFDVASWGRDEDPLPPFVDDPRDQGTPDAPEAVGLPEPVGAPSPEPAPADKDDQAEKDPAAPADPVARDDDGPVVDEGR